MKHTERLRVNAESKASAEHDGDTWTDEDLEWLASWDGSEAYLRELAEVLGRTIEACRQQYHVRNRCGTWTRVTETRTWTRVTETYRGWTEADGDGW